MTVKELYEHAPFCDTLEIVIREHGHGKWLQGYRIGKNVKIFPSELTAEIRERKNIEQYKSPSVYLEPDEEVDVKRGHDLPIKVICKDISRTPEQIGNLIVCSYLPRHVPVLHKDALTHNDFELEINAFPPDYEIPTEEKKPQSEEIEGQMNLEDWIGGES